MKRKNESPVNPPVPDVQSQDEKFLKKLRAALEEILSDPDPDQDQDFSIGVLCKKLLMGRTDFFKKVKAATGKTPNQYVMSYRLERAAQLLEQDYGKVIDVSIAVGFSSPQYFATCFGEEFGQSPTEYQESLRQKGPDKSQPELIIERLDRAIIATRRKLLQKLIGTDEKGTPQREDIFKQVMRRFHVYSVVDETLENINELKFIKEVLKIKKEAELNNKKLGGFILKYLDFFQILDRDMRKNSRSVAAVCMARNFLSSGNGKRSLKVKNYGETFNLHENESFKEQPIAAGCMDTAVLVENDIILTAAHLVNQNNVADLRFVFDYLVINEITALTEVLDKNIYSGVEILHRIHNPDGDWALVKLDREVADREIAAMSQKDIFDGQPVYILGFPCGLPLKLVQGTKIGGITGSYFKCDLNVYGGSSGSPVFCAETHELIGIVSRAKVGDFMWTGSGWLTLPYPKFDINTEGSQCTRISAINQYIVN